MRKYLPLLALLGTTLQAQVQTDYEPLSTKPPVKSALMARLEKRYESDLAKLPKENRAELEGIYQERYDYLKEQIESGVFLYGPEFNDYYQAILDEIFRANPALPAKEVRLFISRDPSPNALCLGEGSLLLNIGLIRRLENESQIAFVLCHELAHYTLNHVNVAIKRHVENLNSKKTQQEIRAISRSEYGRTEKAMQLLKGMVFSSRRHSRMHESQADSLALVYLRNTAYDAREALRCLALLDEVDAEKYPQTPDLKKMLNTPEYPFKDSWLQSEPTLFGGVKKKEEVWNEDSLKTHPDCQKRISLVENQDFAADRKKFVQPEPRFKTMVEIADFEVIQSLSDGGDYGACLYQTLLLLDKYPDNVYLHAIIGHCLYEIYQAQKEHTLGNHVEQPSGETPAPYKTVLTFIHNLRARELANLGWHYLNSRKDRFGQQEGFLFALCRAASITGNEAETKELKKRYLELFPRGKHAVEVRAL